MYSETTYLDSVTGGRVICRPGRLMKRWSCTLHLTLLIVIFGLMATTAALGQSVRLRKFEAYPDATLASIQNRNRLLAARLPKIINGQPVEFVIRRLNRWNPGAVLKVAFQGGNNLLRQQIMDVANEWTQHGNIQLEFKDPNTHIFYEWANNDTTWKADIRISFAYTGYWSLVGLDSINSAVTAPSSPSMNFEAFDLYLPRDWKAVVRHEFGHAFGFEHEHQSPVGGCDNQFRWDDDAGYVPTRDSFGQFIPDAQGRKPGVYTVLGGPPNNWSRSKVDFNLRQFPTSSAFLLGPFNSTSIMKYPFDAWMFKDGEQSTCYSKENVDLSPQDIEGFAQAYPSGPAAVTRILDLKRAFLQTITAKEDIEPLTKSAFKAQLDKLD